MRRFLLFSGLDYYPQGGWSDFKSEHDTLADAIEAGNADTPDWSQVVDSETRQQVYDVRYASDYSAKRPWPRVKVWENGQRIPWPTSAADRIVQTSPSSSPPEESPRQS